MHQCFKNYLNKPNKNKVYLRKEHKYLSIKQLNNKMRKKNNNKYLMKYNNFNELNKII